MDYGYDDLLTQQLGREYNPADFGAVPLGLEGIPRGLQGIPSGLYGIPAGLGAVATATTPATGLDKIYFTLPVLNMPINGYKAIAIAAVVGGVVAWKMGLLKKFGLNF